MNHTHSKFDMSSYSWRGEGQLRKNGDGGEGGGGCSNVKWCTCLLEVIQENFPLYINF